MSKATKRLQKTRAKKRPGKQPRIRRADFDNKEFLANADISEFLNDLPSKFSDARQQVVDNADLCVPGAREALETNPLIALAQQTLTSGRSWKRAELRKFIQDDFSFAYDIVLLGHAFHRRWFLDYTRELVERQHRSSGRSGRRLDSPVLEKGTYVQLGLMGWDQHDFQWHRLVDSAREKIHDAAKAPLLEILASKSLPKKDVTLGELAASMRKDRIYWTAIMNLRICDEDSTNSRLMKLVLRPVSAKVIRRLLDRRAGGVPGGWGQSGRE